jgi:hypothetical protein
MAEFIIAPGQDNTVLTDTSPVEITISVAGKTGDLKIVSLQDFDAPMSKEIFSWQQMNHAGKRQVPTVSAYALNGNMVIDKDAYEGVAVDVTHVAGSAAVLGLMGLNVAGTKITWTYNMGATKYTGSGYVTTLGPKVSTTSTAWTTAVGITVDGDVSKV